MRKLERKDQPDKTPTIQTSKATMMLTPPIEEDYWEYRVQLSETQAIVGFPKFETIGIGFAVEEDWNTNLPYSTSSDEIFDHIAHNKGDNSISDDDCLRAIELIQEAVRDSRSHD